MDKKFEAWLTSVPSRKAPAVCAVGGPPGAGCTTLVARGIADAGWDAVWIAAGAVAGVDLQQAASSAVAVTGRRKIIVVDEFDALTAADPVTTAVIATILKKGVVPIVLIAHGPPAAWRTKAGELVPKDAERIAVPGTVSTRNNNKGLVGAAVALSGGGDVVPTAFRGDGIASGAVYDNYAKYAKTFEDAARIADVFSAHDAIQDVMARGGVHEDPYAALPIATAAISCASRPPDDIEIKTFGSIWSKTNAMYAKKGSVRAICRRLHETVPGGTTMRPHDGLDLVRLAVQGCVRRGALDEAAAVARAAGLDPATLLATMRLWPGSYTLGVHGKIRKLL